MRVDPRTLLFAALLACEALSAEPPADLQLLEFLGEFATEDGEWVDPLDFDPGAQNGAGEEELESRSEPADDDLEKNR